jgi:hypothetical protein
MSLWERIKRIIFWDYYLLKELEEGRELLEEVLVANNMRRIDEEYNK